jgi:hypothetical protein
MNAPVKRGNGAKIFSDPAFDVWSQGFFLDVL